MNSRLNLDFCREGGHLLHTGYRLVKAAQIRHKDYLQAGFVELLNSKTPDIQSQRRIILI